MVWKGIWKTQSIIREGYRWRVGSGTRIKVWQDPWLRGEGRRWITTPVDRGDLDMCVKELFEHNTRQWDVEKIQQIFNIDDAKAITGIPLSGNNIDEDKRIWQHSKTGEYTVKSGYRILMETLTDSSHLYVSGNWRALWNLSMPPKMRMMAWRLAREVVPTRDMLQHRHIVVPWECGLCGKHIENSWHLFLSCEVAESCWEEVGLREVIAESCEEQEGFTQWLFMMIEKAPEDRIQIIMAIIWGLWKERNGRVWRNEIKPPIVIARIAMEELESWKKNRHTIPSTVASEECAKWHPPKEGQLKCNVDGACFADINRGGSGMILRDSNGVVRQYMMKSRDGCPEPKEIEALALWDALQQLVQDRRINVTIEMDCQEVVCAMRKEEDDHTEFGIIIDQCRKIFPSSYDIVFGRRSRNEVAHLVARRSYSCTSPTMGLVSPDWLENALSCICHNLEH
ncbi:Putative ribonuclease H protein At1g65750 [Linum perenne]